MKKILSVLLTLSFILGAMFALAPAASANVYDGTCGAYGNEDTVTWSLNTSSGELYIQGNGSMKDFGSGLNPRDTEIAPWRKNSNAIKTVIIEGVTNIGTYAFYNCGNITEVTIGVTTERIGAYAFGNCQKAKVTIPEGVKTIGDNAFYNCYAMEVSIPDSVTQISTNSFAGCNVNQETENGVTYLGKWVIACDSTTKNIVLRDGTVGIANSLFKGSAIESITIPSSVKSIGESAFENCSLLTNVTGADGLISIGYLAFSGCVLLEELTIPASVPSIDSSVFTNCTLLIKEENGVSYVGNWAITCNEETTAPTLKEGTVGICSDAFFNRSNLTNITLCDGLKYIGKSAFYGCKALSEITLPESVVTIGSKAFYNCGITDIIIPNSVTELGDYTFYNCDITDMIIPNSVTKLGDYTFANCSKLLTITIPESVTSFGEYTFNNCLNMAKIEFLGTEDQWIALAKTGYKWDQNTMILSVLFPAVTAATTVATTPATSAAETTVAATTIVSEITTEITTAVPGTTVAEENTSKATAQTSQNIPTQSEKSGCGATITGSLGLICAIGATAFLLRKKKED